MKTLNKHQSFGIEVETYGLSRQHCAETVQSILGGSVVYEGGYYRKWSCIDGQGRKWSFVTDGSIEPDHDVTYKEAECSEMNSPAFFDYDREIVDLQNVCRALYKAGARATKTCGIHVHIGLGEHTPESLRRLAHLCNARHDLLMEALGVSGHRENDWCPRPSAGFLRELDKPHALDDLDHVAMAYYGCSASELESETTSHYNGARYRGLNLHSVFYHKPFEAPRQTIEFRYFESTLHAGLIRTYIALCLGLSGQALASHSISATPVSIAKSENPAFKMRTWLVQLGLNGAEFANCREHLTRRLYGNLAWRHGEALQNGEERPY